MARTEDKFFRDHHDAAAKLLADAGTNRFKIYKVEEFQNLPLISEMPPKASAEFDQIFVASSGDLQTGRNYLVVGGFRRDFDKQGAPAYDIDPILFAFDSCGNPHSSGVISFHQDFEGRVSPRFSECSCSVHDIYSNSKIKSGSLEDSPWEIKNALSHMVRKHSNEFFRISAEGKPNE
jgi:hypothetical protein